MFVIELSFKTSATANVDFGFVHQVFRENLATFFQRGTLIPDRTRMRCMRVSPLLPHLGPCGNVEMIFERLLAPLENRRIELDDPKQEGMAVRTPMVR